MSYLHMTRPKQLPKEFFENYQELVRYKGKIKVTFADWSTQVTTFRELSLKYVPEPTPPEEMWRYNEFVKKCTIRIMEGKIVKEI